MNFHKAFEVLIGHEGNFTDNPNDRGNWTSGQIGRGELKGTNFGISAMTYPHLDIKNITLSQAREIYKRDFWDALHADQLPETIRFKMFDLAVNSSIKAAVKLLQKAAKTKPDGVYGPATRSAVAAVNPHVLSQRLSGFRLLMIADLRSFKHFGRGWARRIGYNLIRGYS